MSSFDLIVIAGEPSADLHGAKLVEALLKKEPQLKIGAVAGPHLRKTKIHELFPMEKLIVMGFLDVLAALPRLIKSFFQIRNLLLKAAPKAIVFIDYAEFNLKLERSLKKKGVEGKLIHFVCPSIWAWRKKRKQLLEQSVDALLTLLPFESACFQGSKLPVHYVGHPLTQDIVAKQVKRRPIIALFPGSRSAEIEKNFPLQLKVAKRFPEYEIKVSLADMSYKSLLEKLAKGAKLRFVSPANNRKLMQEARLAIATSGTVTLELALFETPTVVTYAIRRFDQFLAQKIFRISLPHYCLVNILGKKEVFPELFGHHFTEEALYNAVKKILLSTDSIVEECRKVRSYLGNLDASEEAARIISSYLVDFPHLQSK